MATHAEIKALFEEINRTIVGHKTETIMLALKDLVAASCCYMAEDPAEAEKMARAFGRDLRKTIQCHFEHYHAQRSKQFAGRRDVN